jgi:hypothetical protein
MANITKLQKMILENLYLRDVEKNEIALDANNYELTETDDIMKVRELVFNIDILVQLKYIDVIDKYYYESDFISFDYMNKAVEIIEERLKISSLGIDYIELRHKRGFKRWYNILKLWLNRQFVDRPYKYLLTHLIAVIIGMAIMCGLMNFI